MRLWGGTPLSTDQQGVCRYQTSDSPTDLGGWQTATDLRRQAGGSNAESASNSLQQIVVQDGIQGGLRGFAPAQRPHKPGPALLAGLQRLQLERSSNANRAKNTSAATAPFKALFASEHRPSTPADGAQPCTPQQGALLWTTPKSPF